MDDQTTTTGTPLSSLADINAANREWWKEGALEHNDLELPTRVITALDNAGITTVEQLKAAGPNRLQNLEGIGKGGFDLIVSVLRALDKQGPTGNRGLGSETGAGGGNRD